MPTYYLHIAPAEVVRLIQAETKAAGGQPECYQSAWQDYVIEEDFDRQAYGLHDGSDHDLVTEEVVLAVEPRVEQDYWVLSVIVCRNLGPRVIEDENALLGAELSLDAFAAYLLSVENGDVSVHLKTQTLAAKRHFDRWWADLSRRHPSEGREAVGTSAGTAAAVPAPTPPIEARHKAPARRRPRRDTNPAKGNWTYDVREAVGVFANPDALEAAVDELEIAGFDRAGISVLGSGKAAQQRLARLHRSVAEIEDEGSAPTAAFVSRSDWVEGEAAATGVPLYVGGIAGAVAVVAAGGALAAAFATALVGGAAGAGLGILLARTIARKHAERIEQQLAQGGFILWVGTPDEKAESRACAILTKNGAGDVHIHQVRRAWGPADRPLAEANPDPLLERDTPAL